MMHSGYDPGSLQRVEAWAQQGRITRGFGLDSGPSRPPIEGVSHRGITLPAGIEGALIRHPEAGDNTRTQGTRS